MTLGEPNNKVRAHWKLGSIKRANNKTDTCQIRFQRHTNDTEHQMGTMEQLAKHTFSAIRGKCRVVSVVRLVLKEK